MSALSLLFEMSRSFWSDAVTAAVFVIWLPAVAESTRAESVSAFVPPFDTVPIVHTPVWALYVPCDATAETNVTPGGSASVTATFVAVSGPRLSRVTV